MKEKKLTRRQKKVLQYIQAYKAINNGLEPGPTAVSKKFRWLNTRQAADYYIQTLRESKLI